MLRRNPASSRQAARPTSRNRQRDPDDAAAASYFDEEAEGTYYQYAGYEPAPSLSEEEATYEAEAGYDAAYPEEAEEPEGESEADRWVGDDWQEPGHDAADTGEQHALVAVEGHYEVTRVLDPGTALPVFISGSYQTIKPGKLGHQPHSLRARRPRPFFMHTLVVGMSLVAFLAVIVAIVPLGTDRQILQVLSSLASFSAPSAGNAQASHPYVVHYADTLQGIAEKFHVQVGGILEINDLVSADQLFTGMRIKIPTDPTYGATYHALLTIPLAPNITPSPPYAYFIAPPGFDSFSVQDYAGDSFGGSFGQCTWWAQHKRPDQDYKGMGDAWAWLYAAPQRGYTVTTTPTANATVIFEPGVESASGIGHVAHVEQLLPGGWVLISEMNFFWNNGGWGRVDYRYITAGPGVYFIV